MVIRKRVQFSTTVDPDLLDEVRGIAELTDVPISKLTDKAFALIIDSYDNPPKMPRNNNSRNLGETKIKTRYGTVQDLAEESLPISDEDLNELADAVALLREKKDAMLRAIREYKPLFPNYDEDLDQPIELTKEEKREILLKRKQKTFGQGSVYDDIDLNNKENSSLDPEELFDLVDENERKKKKGKKEQRSIFDNMEVDLLPSEPIEIDDYPKKSKK